MLRTLSTGHAGVLVLDNANLDDAAYQIVIGACLSAGQRCTSTRRIVVHRRVAAPLKERLIHLLHQLKVGHFSEPDSFMGPLISSQATGQFVDDLKRLGAINGEELVPGAPLGGRRRGYYVTPSLFHVPASSWAGLGERELMGPLLIITECDSHESGARLLAQHPGGLVASVFTASEGDFDKVKQNLKVGLCLRNLPTTWWPTWLPLSPQGCSGNGVMAGVLTARSCTRLAVERQRSDAMDVTMIPPGLPRQL
jgi:aldehyde dehydrogenase (NAD+)